MSLTQLRVISSATLLASPTRVADLVTAAKNNGYEALALTDVNVVYNLVPFYHAAIQAGIKPLLGMQLALPDDNVVLIAENLTGYQQLQKISSAVQFDHLTLAELPEFTGLAVITTERGQMYHAFAAGDGNAAANAVQQLAAKQPASINIGVPGVQPNADLLAFAQLHDWTPVALGDVREIAADDDETRRVLAAIAQDVRLTQVAEDATDYTLPNCDLVTGVLQAAGLAPALAGNAALTARCSVALTVQAPELPAFPVPAGATTVQYLTQLAQTGLAAKFDGAVPDDYQQRLRYELQVIEQMGFADYFLIVQDVIKAANAQGIMTGPGRGSAAGSLVAYSLGITAVDPLEYGLLFERFLNPNRGQMPDIDIDVQDDRRGEVLEYIQQRYGRGHTAQIMATSTFGPRRAVRDVAKVLGMASYAIDALAPEIPGAASSIAAALQQNQRLRDMVRDDQQVAHVLRVAAKVVGLPRTITTHAAGIVLSAPPMLDVVALQRSGVGIGIQTQVTKEYVEQLGLLKIDVLGLRNLGMLVRMQAFVRQQFAADFDLARIPLDDQPTLALFAAGKTTGVFQFESRPMRSVLRKVHPLSFEDVVATAALYRPGPMQYIDEFAARMHGRQPVTYLTPLLAPILASTYGIIVYQEQVMQVASSVGGMSLAAADDLRRAMSKKKQSVIDAGRAEFVAGAQKRGVSAADAETIYGDIENFAGYGFNRSHAVAYGMLAFWLAYIKQHYPAAFFAVQLNDSLGNKAKTQVFVNEAKQAGVTILPPDINLSTSGYRLVKGQIQVGLSAIKGVRRDLINAIVAGRANREPVQSVQEFLLRLDPKMRTTDAIMPLVLAGAFDHVAVNRAELAADLQKIIEGVKFAGANATGMDIALAITKSAVPPLSNSELDAQTAAQLGFYVHGHPVTRFAILNGFFNIGPLASGRSGDVLVVLTDMHVIMTKKGTKMAFLTVQDESATGEVTLFPQQYLQSGALQTGTVYLMRVRPDRNSTNDEPRMIAESVRPASAVVATLPALLFLNLGMKTDVNMKKEVLRVLMRNHGSTRVYVTSGGKSVLLDRRYAVNASADVLGILRTMIGENAVAIRKPAIE
ncbi:DNA polymerase III subunit alpha [Lacticaseibacillus sharpeae]|uniref:DNA-directed DNA polymerase n=1 Tax=Lacticaseibacillus sharpeae JCM 1186 = DSM 20505 TaxID=1291052 RepID=A0A0R1ZLU5_9LACO|nr:DNA polymerase III subunit alpha [Lacticaseibacillus sharpeae]KRM55975.1 DNA polymerase III alpha subunit [Lacticaseibacillus sharpeae JCM 1186 = DSM 20505]